MGVWKERYKFWDVDADGLLERYDARGAQKPMMLYQVQ